MAGIEDMFVNDDEDDEVMTAKAVFEIITQAWINEKLCPELLPHKAEYVEVMTEQIEQMEENVRQLEPTDLRSLIHRQELERIRFLLRSYLRTRLSKIELNSIWLFKNPESLSDEEREFLKEYITITVEPLKLLCDRMPGPIGSLNPNQIEIQPDLETHVFIKSKEDIIGSIIIPDPIREDEVNIKKGSQHIIPYSCIREQMVNERFKPVSYILSIASLSHHIRDATRRGLWFWPFGSTRPIPYPMYLFLLGLLPNFFKYTLNLDKLKSHIIVV